MENTDGEIFEERPLLIEDAAKKTHSININQSWSDAIEKNPKVQKAMTLAPRGMSLATRAEIDPIALI